MTKKPSLLDNVPSIDERLRDQLADGKAKLRTSSKRQAILAVFVAAAAVGSAFRSGTWGLRSTVGLLLALLVAFLAYRGWKFANSPDV